MMYNKAEIVEEISNNVKKNLNKGSGGKSSEHQEEIEKFLKLDENYSFRKHIDAEYNKALQILDNAILSAKSEVALQFSVIREGDPLSTEDRVKESKLLCEEIDKNGGALKKEAEKEYHRTLEANGLNKPIEGNLFSFADSCDSEDPLDPNDPEYANRIPSAWTGLNKVAWSQAEKLMMTSGIYNKIITSLPSMIDNYVELTEEGKKNPLAREIKDKLPSIIRNYLIYGGCIVAPINASYAEVRKQYLEVIAPNIYPNLWFTEPTFLSAIVNRSILDIDTNSRAGYESYYEKNPAARTVFGKYDEIMKTINKALEKNNIPVDNQGHYPFTQLFGLLPMRYKAGLINEWEPAGFINTYLANYIEFQHAIPIISTSYTARNRRKFGGWDLSLLTQYMDDFTLAITAKTVLTKILPFTYIIFIKSPIQSLQMLGMSSSKGQQMLLDKLNNVINAEKSNPTVVVDRNMEVRSEAPGFDNHTSIVFKAEANLYSKFGINYRDITQSNSKASNEQDMSFSKNILQSVVIPNIKRILKTMNNYRKEALKPWEDKVKPVELEFGELKEWDSYFSINTFGGVDVVSSTNAQNLIALQNIYMPRLSPEGVSLMSKQIFSLDIPAEYITEVQQKEENSTEGKKTPKENKKTKQ